MSNRTKLKSYFVTNAVPKQPEFEDLIDSGLNQEEDSIKKLSAGPIALQAQGDNTSTQDVLHFYKNFSDNSPAWKINLNNRLGKDLLPGLSVSNPAGQSQFFIKETDGSVGLGTVNPTAKLHVGGGGNLVVEGKVGIGVNNPNCPISFPDALGQKIALWGQVSNTSCYGFGIAPGTLQIHSSTVNDDVALGYGSSSNFKETMRVKGNGNVGIGTDKPVAKLQVNGAIVASGAGAALPFNSIVLSTEAAGGKLQTYNSQALYINPDGNNVSIGNAAPKAKLHVSNGDVVIEGKLGVGNTAPAISLDVLGAIGIRNAAAWDHMLLAHDGGAALIKAGGAENGLQLQVGKGTNTVPYTDTYLNVMTLMPSGNVGIGTGNPQAKLHVVGSVGSDYSNRIYGYLNNNAPAGKTTGALGVNIIAVSILASDRIVASEFDAVSDKRVKKDFTVSDPRQSLQTLTQVRINDYLYKDGTQHGTALQKGVIAQELEAILPEAVNRHTDFVPDIYALPQSISVNEGVLTLIMTAPHQLATGNIVRLITETGVQEMPVEVLNETSFTVANWKGAAAGIFVYGKQVSDFRTVNYNSLFCLGISAIQALHKQVQQLKEEMKTLTEKFSAALVPAL